MEKEFANRLLTEKLAEYRNRPYAELAAKAGEEDHFEVAGPGRTRYQLEVQFLWDDQSSGNLRVLAAIDDGGWRAFMPLCQDFVKSPDGRFIGE
jgi:hypothetical protein